MLLRGRLAGQLRGRVEGGVRPPGGGAHDRSYQSFLCDGQATVILAHPRSSRNLWNLPDRARTQRPPGAVAAPGVGRVLRRDGGGGCGI
ncbi:hypothetical protein [Ornithinimicrobium kibberense]|uniref:hypothetical protein n=1 Tax=Ornithinimicrobium kibberense TaxID=282060 RepID=UPI00361F8538